MDHNSYTSSSSSSLSCELRIIKAKNIYKKTSGVVFVRCYLHAGNNARVKLDSQEIPSKSDSMITWNQTFSVNCSGSQESINSLKQENLVIELRWRSTAAPFIGRIKGSRLIGRAEVPWRNIVDSTNMEVEKWVVMTPEKKGRRVYDDIINPTALQIAVKVEESNGRLLMEKKRSRGEGCGCNDSCVDYEFFAIEAALEALL